MKMRVFFWIVVMTLFLSLGQLQWAQAKEVCSFTQVEGQVSLLKSGKPPSIPAKVGIKVDVGDTILTEDLARAQLLFIDDSVLTLAPKSQITIESYMYDARKGIRQAVSRLERGIVHGVVTKILKTTEPDFLINTPTAIAGVRGTEFYVVTNPEHFTDIFVISGIIGVRSRSPEFPEWVPVGALETTHVLLGQAPLPPCPIPPHLLEMLRRMMLSGITADYSKETAVCFPPPPPPLPPAMGPSFPGGGGGGGVASPSS